MQIERDKKYNVEIKKGKIKVLSLCHECVDLRVEFNIRIDQNWKFLPEDSFNATVALMRHAKSKTKLCVSMLVKNKFIAR